MSQNAQITDMGYRPYSGPRNLHSPKWWVIARTMMRQTMRKPAYWVTVLLFSLPWLFTGIFFYMQASASQIPFGNMLSDPTAFPSIFLRAFNMQRWGLLIIALISGAGCIAADNRANALLLYLSKPLSHGQYLLGKWLSVFVPVFMASVVPALIIAIYCWLGFEWKKFGGAYPWLLPQIIICAAVPAALFSSVLLGISAWAKSARMAGAILVSLYMLTNIGAMMMSDISRNNNPELGSRIEYYSIQGVINGISQATMKIGVKGDLHMDVLGGMGRHHRGPTQLGEVPLLNVSLIALGLVAAGVAAARIRVKAVEVVKG